jgi:hypothetical protein
MIAKRFLFSYPPGCGCCGAAGRLENKYEVIMTKPDQNVRLQVMEQALRSISVGGLTADAAVEVANKALEVAGVDHRCQWPNCKCERHCAEVAESVAA